MRYLPRVVDRELQGLTGELPALLIEGAKGVGKTETARRLARSVYMLDDPAVQAIAHADHTVLLQDARPVLIDEWERVPEMWDFVRRAVDAGAELGSYLLTGSASVEGVATHSGAGRIASLRMRPMTLSERGVGSPTVSLSELLDGVRPKVTGRTTVTLGDYADAIVDSGFPGLHGLLPHARRRQLDGYIDRIVTKDFPEQGQRVRRPATLRRWMTAYAAASSTAAKYEVILDGSTAGDADKPARSTTLVWRDVLERLGILDPVPAWSTTRSEFSRLTEAPKHQLADPALAARLLHLGRDALLRGRTAEPRITHAPMLGLLFESLVTLDTRVYAQAVDATVSHLRTKGGEHEVDLIVENDDRSVVAVEVKLTQNVVDRDVRHLRWLRNQLGDALLDAVVVSTGTRAYRRADGIAVVPAALLGP
ncbi:MAG: ATP-binding protein [Acidimicrobiia bacterium]|nr:ATP-binding protein [Acidimicrobiia bacterium]